MKSSKDEFGLMDELQDDVDAAITEMLPFEPDREMREDTKIEDEVRALPKREQADLESDDVVDPLEDLEMPVLEELDG
jgi:hypothetical protein